jgi:DNA-binding GntR family transcriptional regulator
MRNLSSVSEPGITVETTASRDGKGSLKSYLAIYHALKREIVLGEIAPGQPLPEVEIAQRFKLSRAPVREAFIHLAREGLATASPYGGYLVPEVSIQELKELYELRLILEPEAAERAARNAAMQSNPLKELEKWIEKQESHPVNLENLPLQIEAEVGIHTTIARMSGNTLLSKMVFEITERYQRHHVWLFKELWKRKVEIPGAERNRTHRQILETLRKGDGAGARALMHDHISKATQVWLSVYFQS